MTELLHFKALDFWSVFIGVIVFLASVQYVIKLIGFFVKMLGIQTKAQKKEQAIEKRIATLEKNFDAFKQQANKELGTIHAQYKTNEQKQAKGHTEFMEVIQDIKLQLYIIQQNEINEKIKSKRGTILKFASDLSSGKQVFRENYEYIFATHQEYEDLLASMNQTNGQVDVTMQYIDDCYREALNSGTLK